MKRTNTFYEFKIVVKIFNAWVQWYYQFSRICNIMRKIQQIMENKMKQKIFLYWKSYIFHKKCMKRKLFLCLTKYHKKISTNAFNKLQDYVLYKKRKQTQMLSLSTQAVTIIIEIQNMYIEKWKKKLNIHMQEKHRTFLAIEFYNNYISKQYLFLWKKFSQQYKLKLLQKKKLDELASYFLLNKYIMIWKLKCEDNYKICEKEKLMVSVVHKRIQKKYLMFWKKYIAQKIDKKRDIECAKNINKKFLLQEGLREILRHSLYTMQFHHESRIKYTTLKLVEDFEILSKYFDRWLSIVYLKDKLEFPLSEIKYRNIKENIKTHSIENIGEDNSLFNNDNISIIVPSLSLSSEDYRNNNKFKYIDTVSPFNYIRNKSDELDSLFMYSMNNNLYSIPLYNDKSMFSLPNNVKLLPPSAFY